MGDRAEREALFEWVYENNQWGRSSTGARYYSDSPSEATAPYRGYLESFLAKHPEIRTVVDLACGDYQLSRETALDDRQYIGVDIYHRLIEHNRSLYGDERHLFLTLDLVEDELPGGDLCLVSMALYLMSHADVLQILKKLKRYRYVLVTDGQPDLPPSERRNIDRPTGKYTPRDLYGAGFYLELPPFNQELRVVCEHRLPSGEILRTVLMVNDPQRATRL
jgi:hypothetical protein